MQVNLCRDGKHVSPFAVEIDGREAGIIYGHFESWPGVCRMGTENDCTFLIGGVHIPVLIEHSTHNGHRFFAVADKWPK